jgi:hypothetical protein
MTIVAGIVIAIGLEQAVETLHWHEKVKAAREALRHELQRADEFYAFRVAINECVAQRLSQLNDIVESAAQTLVHFPASERERYGSTYGQQIDIRSWMNEELAVWAAIRILQGNPDRLSASDLTLIRQNIQIARSLNYLIVVNARDQLSRASALGLPKVKAPAEQVRVACEPLKRAAPSIPYTTY